MSYYGDEDNGDDDTGCLWIALVIIVLAIISLMILFKFSKLSNDPKDPYSTYDYPGNARIMGKTEPNIFIIRTYISTRSSSSGGYVFSQVEVSPEVFSICKERMLYPLCYRRPDLYMKAVK